MAHLKGGVSTSYMIACRRRDKRGSTLGSSFSVFMYRVDKYAGVVICLRREYNKIIIISMMARTAVAEAWRSELMMKLLLHSWLRPDGICTIYVYYVTSNILDPSGNASLSLARVLACYDLLQSSPKMIKE